MTQIMLGDCAEVLKDLEPESIDLVVTSPPYDGLRTYNGYSFDFEAIANELKRVLKPGGVIVWVVGDSTVKGSESGTSFRQALYFKSIGLNLHDTMIYAKANPIPQNHNRYEQQFEYMFILTKGKPNTFNPIQIPTIHGGKAIDWGKRKSLDENAGRRAREDSDVKITNALKSRFNIWEYPVGGGKSGHPAVFPLQLALDHVTSWSNPGDVVLDPFLGSGTTAEAALKLDRKFIGIEISEEYFQLSEQRIRDTLAARKLARLALNKSEVSA